MINGFFRIIIFLIIISAIIFGTIPQEISAEIFYPTTNYRLDGPPTYCIITPDDDISDEKKEQWVNIARDAVLEWETKLKAAESENKSIWEIDVIIVQEGESIPSTCDVDLNFEDKPFLEITLAGIFSWPPGNIIIYYLELVLCNLIIPCYDDETLKSDDAIFTTTLHEVGHSFGLDHYVSDDAQINRSWYTGFTSPPSVMIPTIHANPSLQKITDVDIQKVRSIYSSEGFFAFGTTPVPTPEPTPVPTPEPTPVPTPEPTPVPEPIPPIIPVLPFESMNISEEKIIVTTYETKLLKISGKISEDKYLRGHPVLLTVYKPDLSVEILKIVLTGRGYFETFLIFDKDSQIGFYRISASYIEHVDKDMDISFQVTRETNTNPPVITSSSPTPDESSFKKVEKIKKVPEWIKHNAEWWSKGQIADSDFISGIQHLIEEKIISIPNLPEHVSKTTKENIPNWIKNNAGWWADGLISEDDFVNGIQYLVERGIIRV